MPVDGKTDVEGRFRINPNPGLRFTVTAYPPEGVAYQIRELTDLRVEAGQAAEDLEIRLAPGVFARGVVVDATTGQPLADASVQYYAEEVNNPNYTEDFVTGWRGIQKTDQEGKFAIPVLPGPGRLLVHAAENNYILQESSYSELKRGRPGSRRVYAHAIQKIDPDLSDESEELRIELQPGATVSGKLTDAAGQPIERALVVSRQIITPSHIWWRSRGVETTGGVFQIQGLAEGEEYKTFFYDPAGELGATATISTNSPDPTIVLKPCGAAKARFVDHEGNPVRSGLMLGLNIVMTPGPPMSVDAYNRGEVLADEDLEVNIDQTNFVSRPMTDANGEITFSKLIPGATYRFINRDDPMGGRVTIEFVAKSGETFDMGELVVDLAP
jgi:protocatechuate 3,4-dioxygenase beta subunit